MEISARRVSRGLAQCPLRRRDLALLTSSGGYQSETAWFFSGGGYSPYEPEPSYQRSVQTTGQRATPDVAFDADPNTGVEVYETSPRSGKGSWQVSAGQASGLRPGQGSSRSSTRAAPRRQGEPGRSHPDVTGSLRASLERLPQREAPSPRGVDSRPGYGSCSDPTLTARPRTSRRDSDRPTANPLIPDLVASATTALTAARESLPPG